MPHIQRFVKFLRPSCLFFCANLWKYSAEKEYTMSNCCVYFQIMQKFTEPRPWHLLLPGWRGWGGEVEPSPCLGRLYPGKWGAGPPVGNGGTRFLFLLTLANQQSWRAVRETTTFSATRNQLCKELILKRYYSFSGLFAAYLLR